MIVVYYPDLILVAVTIWLSVAYWPVYQEWRQDRSPHRQKKKESCGQSVYGGLTQKPECASCQQEEGQPRKSPPLRPPQIKSKRGRPRSVETGHHYCPEPGCAYYGWVNLGNIRANGRPNGGPWRQLECVVCGRFFMETEGTLLYGSQTAVETICRALASLAEGMAVRGVGRVFEVDPNTVLDWLAQAASHIEAVSHFLLHDLQVSQVQMDELYALLSQIDQGELSPQEAARRLRRPHRWVWGAIDPVSKVMLATVVGDRSLATAQRLVHAVVRVLAPGVAPVFVTDGLAHYATALLTHFGDWVSLPRQGSRGPHPKPRWLPLPQLHYAQVVKRRVKSRVVEVTTRIVYGTVEVIQQTLAQQGWQINTAFIERLNRTIRHQVPALGRRVVSLAKTSQGLSQQLSLWRGYYNFCLPHTSLRLALPEPRPTRGQGSPKKWRPRTPAMAAEVTSHLWTMKDLLLFRVPPWPQAVAA